MAKTYHPIGDEIDLEPGTHLVSRRLGYTHHGIYIGDGLVIHYSGLAHDLKPGMVEVTKFSDFRGNQLVWVRPHPNAPHHGEQIVKRARSRLGEDGYSVFGNNCQHFVNWCIYGKHESSQVDWGVGGLVAVATGLISQLANFAVSVAGSVSGLSAAGIMSGIKALSFGFGGAVGGLILTPVTIGVLISALMHRYILNVQKEHSKSEKLARRIGQVSSYLSGVAASAGGVALISTYGATAGLGAAGITSGLATIGSIVGGGMAAGTIMVMAAPAVAALAGGYGAYKIAQHFLKPDQSITSKPPQLPSPGSDGTNPALPPPISSS
ncbi:lecithin retinol acyltransferase family protein [Acidocella aminolytica]|uniref:lecithin retinol acyltransferase family protein n=1 Tax=Acidocella aminolytica TaxID=33998 RepID=UPI00090EDBD0|nr:lecithin retinol acyltransferase family protein [Acidocella aminolytica]SHE67825.1 Lecithin retinol acyltransferase [Acidocella aminolytica 101 = DSM 11237]